MAVQPTDLILVERSGVAYKATVADLPSGGEGPPVTISDTPPPSPSVGDFWVDTN